MVCTRGVILNSMHCSANADFIFTEQLLKKVYYLKNDENRKKLSSNEIKHLKHRIKIMKELNEIGEKNRKALRENNRTSLIAPITRKDGTVELAHIHQDKVQNTFNGCWSVSLQLLLQSRGVKLTQEQIRGFRHNFVNDEEVKELDEGTEKDIIL